MGGFLADENLRSSGWNLKDRNRNAFQAKQINIYCIWMVCCKIPREIGYSMMVWNPAVKKIQSPGQTTGFLMVVPSNGTRFNASIFFSDFIWSYGSSIKSILTRWARNYEFPQRIIHENWLTSEVLKSG